ncbi:MAG: hypothetical protein AAGF20_06745 [Pseudomonadota bacterium]
MEEMIDEAGNVWLVDAQGNPVQLVQSAPEGMPADPTFPFQGDKAEAETRQAQNQARASALDPELQRARIQQAQAAAAASGASAAKTSAERDKIEGRISLTPAQQKADEEFAKMYADMQASGGIADIRKQVDQLRGALKTLKDSDTISGPVIGRLPQFVQQAIDPNAINVREQVEEVIQRNLRLVLGAQFTEKEGERLISRAFNPTLEEATNADRLTRLIDQMDGALNMRESAINFYERNGTIAGWSPSQLQSAMDVTRLQNLPQETQAGGFGAETQSLPIPPEMQQEYNAFVAQGNFTPESYAAFRAGLDRKYFPDTATGQPGVYRDEGARILEGLQTPGSTQNLTIPRPEVPLSERDQRRNNLANVPGIPALANAANTLSFGAVEAGAPEQIAALNQAYPGQALAGQIVGGVGGVSALGRTAALGASKVAPSLLGGGEAAAFGRGLAADGGYGAIYGEVTDNNPLLSGAIGVGGSALGQTIGRGVGAAVGGVRMSPEAEALLDRGVSLTTGRRLGGGFARAEDAAQSIPVVGDAIRGRQLDSFQDFNRAAFEEGASSLPNTTITDIGEEGLGQLAEGYGEEYATAIGGNPAPLDRQFLRDLVPVRQMARSMSPQNKAQLGDTLSDAVQVPADAGQISGSQFQDAMASLRNLRNNPAGVMPNSQNTLRNASTQIMDALEGAVRRSGGEEGIEALNNANTAYRRSKVLEDATQRAAGGSQTGEIFTFTPSQLQRAGLKNQKKFKGRRPFGELADLGQQVLPSSLPNSGTTDRALMTAALGAGGVGATEGYYSEGVPSGTLSAVGLAALLAAGGTRGGQGSINGVLFNRPRVVQQVGDAVRRRRGLFGSAIAVPAVTN